MAFPDSLPRHLSRIKPIYSIFIVAWLVVGSQNAYAEDRLLPISQLDLGNISVQDATWLSTHGYKVYIPLRATLPDLEAVTIAVPTLAEVTHALALLKSRDLKSVRVTRSYVTYNTKSLEDPCRERGLDPMTPACWKLSKETKVEMFETVECKNVCSISALNF